MITVADLIEFLSEHDPTAPVLIARDPEGNGFHKAAEVEATTVYDDPATSWRFEDAGEGDHAVVVIWP